MSLAVIDTQPDSINTQSPQALVCPGNRSVPLKVVRPFGDIGARSRHVRTDVAAEVAAALGVPAELLVGGQAGATQRGRSGVSKGRHSNRWRGFSKLRPWPSGRPRWRLSLIVAIATLQPPRQPGNGSWTPASNRLRGRAVVGQCCSTPSKMPYRSMAASGARTGQCPYGGVLGRSPIREPEVSSLALLAHLPDRAGARFQSCLEFFAQTRKQVEAGLIFYFVDRHHESC